MVVGGHCAPQCTTLYLRCVKTLRNLTMDKYLRCGNNTNAFHHLVMHLLCGNDTVIQYMANFLCCGNNTNVLKCMEIYLLFANTVI